MTTGSRAGTLSRGLNVWPISGRTPRSENSDQVTDATLTSSGSPLPVSATS